MADSTQRTTEGTLTSSAAAIITGNAGGTLIKRENLQFKNTHTGEITITIGVRVSAVLGEVFTVTLAAGETASNTGDISLPSANHAVYAHDDVGGVCDWILTSALDGLFNA